MAFFTATMAMPVSHGEANPITSNGQHGNYLKSQDLQSHPQPLHREHHESLEDSNHWANSLFVDGHASPVRSMSPSLSNATPVNEKQPFKNNLDYLKWIESVLIDDNDHHDDDHVLLTISPPYSLASSRTQIQQSSSSRPSTSSSIVASVYNSQPASSTDTKEYNHLAQTRKPRKPKWSKGRTLEEIANIHKGLDQMIVGKFGTYKFHRRGPFASRLTSEQLDYLAEGHSPLEMPVPARKTAKRGDRRKSWKEGLSDQDVEKILAFSDVFMAQRKGTSSSTRNNMLSSLTNEELLAIARGDEDRKKQILSLLAPKHSKAGVSTKKSRASKIE